MKKIILIILIAIPFFSFSQLNLDISVNKNPLFTEDADTLSVCRDTMIIFKATLTLDGTEVTGAGYFWDFDDGTEIDGVDKDSVTHIYTEGGGYRAKLYVSLTNGTHTDTIIPIKIAIPPDYSKSLTDIPKDFDGVCINSEVQFTGKAVPVLWEDEPVYEVVEELPKEINDSRTYDKALTFDEFKQDNVFAVGDIDSIGIKLEHSDMGNLQIKLTCPNGTSVNLKNYDTSNHSYLGEPIDDEAIGENGVLYQYYWSMSSVLGTINSNTTSTIPSGAYLPDDNFSALANCPMNGDWSIEITDNTALDNGFISEWNIIFSEDALPPVWEFKDSLKQYVQYDPQTIYSTYWTGNNVGITGSIFSGDTLVATSVAEPDTYGNLAYDLHVISNWACPQDTTLNITVEEPSFTASPESGEAKLDVTLTNTTTWATSYSWKFGDNSKDDGEEVEHQYLEKGEYEVILTVSDKNKCTDTDTLKIKVTVEPSEIAEVPNIFTPNDDGVNDIYTIEVKGMKEFYIQIYSRWGEKVYETTDQEAISETGWDGRLPLTKIKAPPGVYFYIIKGEGKDEQKYKEKGTFHLIR